MDKTNKMFTTSIIIRALNEAKHIDKLLYGISQQTMKPDEIILVDSGSTDDTIKKAQKYNVKVIKIEKNIFTFGRALNFGCKEANSDILVFVSAHVYPVDKDWLQNLIQPFSNPNVASTFGKQRGNINSKFSEHQIFSSWFQIKRILLKIGISVIMQIVQLEKMYFGINILMMKILQV